MRQGNDQKNTSTAGLFDGDVDRDESVSASAQLRNYARPRVEGWTSLGQAAADLTSDWAELRRAAAAASAGHPVETPSGTISAGGPARPSARDERATIGALARPSTDPMTLERLGSADRAAALGIGGHVDGVSRIRAGRGPPRRVDPMKDDRARDHGADGRSQLETTPRRRARPGVRIPDLRQPRQASIRSLVIPMRYFIYHN